MFKRKIFVPLAVSATIAGTSMMSVSTPASAADASAFSCSVASNGDFTCSVSGSASGQTDGGHTLVVPVGTGLTVNVGTFPMKSGAGTMTISATSTPGTYDVSFSFYDDYYAAHPNNLTYTGTVAGHVDTYAFSGPWSVQLDSQSETITSTGGFCDAACHAAPLAGTSKSTWFNGWNTDGSVGSIGSSLVLGTEDLANRRVGEIVTFTDTVSAGQDNCVYTLFEYAGHDLSKELVPTTAFSGSTVSVDWTVTPLEPNHTVGLNVSCDVTAGGTYSDAGVIGGTPVAASVGVTSSSADGSGTAPTPAPSTPAPKVKKITYRVQVDKTQVKTSKQAAALAKTQLKGLYFYRADVVWNTRTGAIYSHPLWDKGVSKWVIASRTITVPVNATPAQILATEKADAAKAYSVPLGRSAAGRIGHVTTTVYIIPAGSWDIVTTKTWRDGLKSAPQILAGAKTA